MDLMSGSTSYAALKEKYNGFTAVTVRVTVDGVELIQKLGTGIADLAVELTSDYAASGCSFSVLNEYDSEKTAFKSEGVENSLQLGAKVEVALGYIVTETVFCGYITEITYEFGEEISPNIRVECVDAKCLLMKSQRLEIMAEKKISQAVEALLSAQPVSSYLKGKEINTVAGEEQMLETVMENDYEFIVRHARYIGCEFFMFQGKAYFRDPPKAASPIMTVSPGQGILTARCSLRGGKLSKSVRIMGVSPDNDEAIKGTAQTDGKFSSGATASRMLGKSEKVFFDPKVQNAQEAEKRAKAMMQELESDFGRLECTCVGMPEIVPGRCIKVEGLCPQANKTAYVTFVRHLVNEEGFTTIFEARMDSL